TFSSGAATLTSNPTSGNLLVIIWRDSGSGTFGSCTDTLGTNFALVGKAHNTDASGQIQLTLRAGIAPSTGADTVSCSGSSNSGGIVSEFSNLFYAADNIVATLGSSNSPISSTNLTTLSPNEELLSGATNFTDSTNLTIQSPFTQAGSAGTTPNTGYEAAT